MSCYFTNFPHHPDCKMESIRLCATDSCPAIRVSPTPINSSLPLTDINRAICGNITTPQDPKSLSKQSSQGSRSTRLTPNYRCRKGKRRSPTSVYQLPSNPPLPAIPSAFAHNPSRKAAWIKARTQSARDRDRNRSSMSHVQTRGTSFSPMPEASNQGYRSATLISKRNHTMKVKAEELKCLIEDQAGTIHGSELGFDESVDSNLRVGELQIEMVEEMEVDGESDVIDIFPDELDVVEENSGLAKMYCE